VTSPQTRALSFGGVAADYDRLRPAPAPQALDWLVPDGCRAAIDLAAGTGLFTRALAERVPEVIAVEPDPRMREMFSARTPQLEIREGRGEAIPAADASADLVTISSAWHWLDPEQAGPELARVLRPGGRLGVIWTHMAHDERIPRPDWVALGVDAGDRDRVRRQREVRLPDGSPFGPTELASFSYPHEVSKADIVATLATYSPVIALAPDVREAALGNAAAQLDERYPGEGPVEVTITSQCVRLERLPD
jgi:SAM-dependent methyltransferase